MHYLWTVPGQARGTQFLADTAALLHALAELPCSCINHEEGTEQRADPSGLCAVLQGGTGQLCMHRASQTHSCVSSLPPHKNRLQYAIGQLPTQEVSRPGHAAKVMHKVQAQDTASRCGSSAWPIKCNSRVSRRTSACTLGRHLLTERCKRNAMHSKGNNAECNIRIAVQQDQLKYQTSVNDRAAAASICCNGQHSSWHLAQLLPGT